MSIFIMCNFYLIKGYEYYFHHCVSVLRSWGSTVVQGPTENSQYLLLGLESSCWETSSLLCQRRGQNVMGSWDEDCDEEMHRDTIGAQGCTLSIWHELGKQSRFINGQFIATVWLETPTTWPGVSMGRNVFSSCHVILLCIGFHMHN